MSHPPGVLVLIADDWSPLADCYGNEVIQTPNIDRLAERSIVFEEAFCTAPTCAASRACILTGLHTHQHGQYGHPHSYHGFRTHEHLVTQTLPAVLSRADVYTGMIGKDHIAPHWVYPFDVFDYRQPWSVESMRVGARDFFAAAADRPFYLQVASLYPHRTGDSGFNREQCGDELRAGDVAYDPADVVVPDWLPDHPDVRRDLGDYYTFVSRYDRFVGAILRELERSGRMEQTLILLLSDHGMPFPGAKASMYDGGHRCPLIISCPGKPSLRNDAIINWTDIYPTACDYLGVSRNCLPEDMPGRSLLPVLDDPSPAGWDRTFMSHCFHEVTNYYPYRIARDRRYKLVHNVAHQLPLPLASDLFGSRTWQAVLRDSLPKMGKRSTSQVLQHAPEELYDLQIDPNETANLVAEPAYEKTAAELREALQAFRERTSDPWLSVDAHQEHIKRAFLP